MIDNSDNAQHDLRTGTYLLAGIPIRITSVYKRVHDMCAPYSTTQEPELTVTTSMEEIKMERQRSNEDAEDATETSFSHGYIETLLVYRKIATAALQRRVLLMHGSCIEVNGEVVMFTALSGTGKSTHTRLWRKMLDCQGKEYVMVNDDKPLVAVPEAGQPIVYGTPWDGKHHLSSNTSAPLRAIVYLQRGEHNTIEEVTADKLFAILVQQTFMPDNALDTMKTLNLMSEMAHKVRFFDLHCTMDDEAAEVAYSAIFGA